MGSIALQTYVALSFLERSRSFCSSRNAVDGVLLRSSQILQHLVDCGSRDQSSFASASSRRSDVHAGSSEPSSGTVSKASRTCLSIVLNVTFILVGLPDSVPVLFVVPEVEPKSGVVEALASCALATGSDGPGASVSWLRSRGPSDRELLSSPLEKSITGGPDRFRGEVRTGTAGTTTLGVATRRRLVKGG